MVGVNQRMQMGGFVGAEEQPHLLQSQPGQCDEWTGALGSAQGRVGRWSSAQVTFCENNEGRVQQHRAKVTAGEFYSERDKRELLQLLIVFISTHLQSVGNLTG